MTTHSTPRPGTTRRIGFGQSTVVVRAARPGDVVRDVLLGASKGAMRDACLMRAYDATGQWVEASQFGGRWPQDMIGAEPEATRRTP